MISTNLQYTIKLRRKHHVPLRLQLASHERLLAVELHTDRLGLVEILKPAELQTYLALCKLCERLVRKYDGDIRLGLRLSLVHRAGLLEIDCPDGLLSLFVLHAQLKDTVCLEHVTLD